ncbi:short-subunit dehydrogenase [Pseudonocardia sediminis]|uniref:Short-subunit dehydrogenase n=1 Tax=Pseudonocardia sediminis TaxID=1397368 RepID=A0A4Q7USH2_PSEST|nr:SDR family NAD(P)-dependent oxidoreductase [Pseudonocardia sediminis]RZT83701.1 short-subunit dehydrogenase [Pseudonocardia sediminis]
MPPSLPSEPGDAPVALVTGASTGIGRAIALRLAAEGFTVFGTSRVDRDDADGVTMLRLDVTDPGSVDACVGSVLARAGRIDVVVNNAGVLHEGVAEETTTAQAEAVFATNLFGVTRVSNAVLPGMRARRHGRIVNIGSLAAWVGEPGSGFYAASKAALARYTEALHHEVADLGVDVSLIECGTFTSEIGPSASASSGVIADYDHTREAAHRTLHERLDGGADPAGIAAVVLDIVRSPAPRLSYGASPEARRVPAMTVMLPERFATGRLRRSFGLRRLRRRTA